MGFNASVSDRLSRSLQPGQTVSLTTHHIPPSQPARTAFHGLVFNRLVAENIWDGLCAKVFDRSGMHTGSGTAFSSCLELYPQLRWSQLLVTSDRGLIPPYIEGALLIWRCDRSGRVLAHTFGDQFEWRGWNGYLGLGDTPVAMYVDRFLGANHHD